MTRIKFLSLGFALVLLQACSHPIEIVGQGDVISASGTRNCLLEDFEGAQANCTRNYVAGDYQETYSAVPRPFWFFDRWKNWCVNATNNQCVFNTPAAFVQQFWGDTIAPLQAVFAKHQLTGPVLPDSTISLGLGPISPTYQVKEFFLAGTANSYTPELPLPGDGKLVVSADPDTAGGTYKTRLVVVRPIDPEDFNGTVIVEWLNVTAGADSPPDWIMAHNEFLRMGYAWVGVSAQAVGVNSLKNSGGLVGARYASLLHPGDSYSYSIFSHAGVRAKEPAARLLGGLTAERVIAVGESQSAGRMVTYIDAVQPIENIYDGFMVHSRFGSGAAIAQSPLAQYSFPAPAPIRDDLYVPVMVVQAEGDVIGSNLAARQPDTPMFRAWEMAGTAHADAYTLAGLNDNGDGSTAITMFGFMRAPNNPFGCNSPINAGGHHWILQAAFRSLDTWTRTGVAPATGTPLAVVSSSPVILQRDAFGNAIGGVRSPHVDAPVATLDSMNGGIFFCGLFGRTIPFSPAQIQALYPTKEDFMTQWINAINSGVEDGFLLAEDVAELTAAAEAWDYPN